jgi:hypothetical protein
MAKQRRAVRIWRGAEPVSSDAELSGQGESLITLGGRLRGAFRRRISGFRTSAYPADLIVSGLRLAEGRLEQQQPHRSRGTRPPLRRGCTGE